MLTMRRNDDPPDIEEYCDICFQSPESCVCKRCRKCGTVGDAECYKDDAILFRQRRRPSCGLVLSGEQWRLRFKAEAAMVRQHEAELAYEREQQAWELEASRYLNDEREVEPA